MNWASNNNSSVNNIPDQTGNPKTVEAYTTSQAANTKNQWNINSGVLSTSRLGFKGVEDLGNGLKALFTLEYVRVQRAGRIVRIDDDDGARILVDLAADIIQIRELRAISFTPRWLSSAAICRVTAERARPSSRRPGARAPLRFAFNMN